MNEDRAERTLRLASEPLVPAGPVSGFVGGTADSVRGVWRYRELLDLLVRRELKARYKDSALGFLWSLIRPLTQLLIYYIAIGKFLGAERSIPDFAIYIFTGLTAWALFSEIITTGTGSIVANGGLVKKIYLPREVFPLSRHRVGALQLRHPVGDPGRWPRCSPASRPALGRLRLCRCSAPPCCWSTRPRPRSCCRRSTSTCATSSTWSRSC